MSCECRGGREAAAVWLCSGCLSQRQAQTFFHNAKHKHKLLLCGCALAVLYRFLQPQPPPPPSSESVGHADAAEEKPARRLPRAFHAAARQPSKEQKGNGRVEEEGKCCEL